MEFTVNTSNPDKLKEYERFLGNIKSTKVDLDEPLANLKTIVAFKASQFDENVIVEDVSLEVEGADIGVEVKFKLDELKNLVGRKATFKIAIAFKKDNKVNVFVGEVEGKIVEKEKNSPAKTFGFDAYFKPKGANKTLAVDKPDKFNARAIAIKKLLRGKTDFETKPIPVWNGPFQK